MDIPQALDSRMSQFHTQKIYLRQNHTHFTHRQNHTHARCRIHRHTIHTVHYYVVRTTAHMYIPYCTMCSTSTVFAVFAVFARSSRGLRGVCARTIQTRTTGFDGCCLSMDHARSSGTLEDTLDDPWHATDIKPTGDLLSATSCAVAWPSPQEPARSRGTRDVDAERCDDGSLMNESVVDASADNGRTRLR